jgi:hypothetical protein
MGLISFVVCLYRYLYFRSFKTPITFIVRLHSRWGAGAGCHRVYSRFLLIRVSYLSVSDPDPDSIRSLDLDSESGSGSRRAKMAPQK